MAPHVGPSGGVRDCFPGTGTGGRGYRVTLPPASSRAGLWGPPRRAFSSSPEGLGGTVVEIHLSAVSSFVENLLHARRYSRGRVTSPPGPGSQ